jgi:hypothetical protein
LISKRLLHPLLFILKIYNSENHTVPTEQSSPAGNHSIDNLSAHSIVGDPDKENSGQGITSLDNPQSQTLDLDSEGMSPEENMADTNSDFSAEYDTVSDNNGCEEQFSTALGHDPDMLGDLVSKQIGCRVDT